jgi:hypothetical protein
MEYFLNIDYKVSGPYSLGQLESMVKSGKVTLLHRVKTSGSNNWVKMTEIPELKKFFDGTASSNTPNRQLVTVTPKKQAVAPVVTAAPKPPAPPPQYNPNQAAFVQPPPQYNPNQAAFVQPPQYNPNQVAFVQPPQYNPNQAAFVQPPPGNKPERKLRHGFTTFYLWVGRIFGILASLFVFVVEYFLEDVWQLVVALLPSSSFYLWVIRILMVADWISFELILRWKRSGFWLYSASMIAFSFLIPGEGGILVNLISSAISIGILYGVLHFHNAYNAKTTWEQLE